MAFCFSRYWPSLALLGFFLTLLTACTSTVDSTRFLGTSPHPTLPSQQIPKTNFEKLPESTSEADSLRSKAGIVKVLDSINCVDCNQETINAAWQKCLESGFSEQNPDDKVRSSRSINELVKFEYTSQVSYPVNVPTQSTDSSGVVTTSYESLNKTKDITHKVKAFCVGSEYILD